jgi:hypothetical protein
MGAGIAAAIADKLLTPESYEKYQRFCATNGAKALGYTFYLDAIDGRLIANMFSQKAFDAGGDLTDYQAMLNCFAHVRKLAAKENRSVSIPAGIGCGIAGGDWEKVRFVINKIFGGPGVEATIYYKNREITAPTF